MSDFVALLPSESARPAAITLFRSILARSRTLQKPAARRTIETDWLRLSAIPREDGSGAPLVADEKSRHFLLALGTWFHRDGYQSGEEDRLLERYREVGPEETARELEGFFLVAVGDNFRRELVLITDLLASLHGFSRVLKEGIALSTSSLVLAAAGEVSPDPAGAQEFLRTGVVYEDRTCYQEIRKLQPATVYRFASGEVQSQTRYWRASDLTPESVAGDHAVERLWDGLTRAASKVARIFERPVCDLTGGYDSRAMVAAFWSAGVDFSTVVSGRPESADVVVAGQLAGLMAKSHQHVPPGGAPDEATLQRALALTDGEYDLIEYARVMENHLRLRHPLGVSINGSFGEVARGYWWELLVPHTGSRRRLDARRLARLRFNVAAHDPSLFPEETRIDLDLHLGEVIQRTNEDVAGAPNTFQMDHVYLMMRMQRWQGRIATSTHHIWPCLSPFLFRSVLETMLQTESRLRTRSLLIRRMLARFQPRLAAFPLEHGYPAMPVTARNFHRFWPLLHHYAGRAWEKLAPSFLHHNDLVPDGTAPLPARLALWREEAVREVLRVENMRLADFLDRDALHRFLSISREASFSFDGAWARLLSLELALRAQSHARLAGRRLPESDVPA
jgi:hypothetical protein